MLKNMNDRCRFKMKTFEKNGANYEGFIMKTFHN